MLDLYRSNTKRYDWEGEKELSAKSWLVCRRWKQYNYSWSFNSRTGKNKTNWKVKDSFRKKKVILHSAVEMGEKRPNLSRNVKCSIQEATWIVPYQRVCWGVFWINMLPLPLSWTLDVGWLWTEGGTIGLSRWLFLCQSMGCSLLGQCLHLLLWEQEMTAESTCSSKNDSCLVLIPRRLALLLAYPASQW